MSQVLSILNCHKYHQNNRQNISKKSFQNNCQAKLWVGWPLCPNLTWLTNINQNFSLSDLDKNEMIFLKTSPDRLNLEMVFDVIDQPTSQSVVCSVFCHYPWKFCNKNTRCERVVLVDAPDYTVESLFWFQLHVISCWSSSRNHFSVAWLSGALRAIGFPIHDLPWQRLQKSGLLGHVLRIPYIFF